MLKQGVTTDEIKIYELYIQRIQKEYDLIWSRFKIYFGFNSGLLVVIGFLFQQYPSIKEIIINDGYTDLLLLIKWILILIGIVGFGFSICWFFVNYNGKFWQKKMNQVLANIEEELFLKSKINCGMFYTINNTNFCGDVMNINIILSIIFCIIWIYAIYLIVTLLSLV